MSVLQKMSKVLTLGVVALVTFFSVSTIAQEFDFVNNNSNVGIVPATPGKEPITKAWFIETIKPGEGVEQTATIVNNSDKELPVIVIAKDSIQTAQGGFTFKENSDEDTEVGTWIEFIDSPKLTVPANSNVPFRFKINVPQGTASGEYAGVLAVQEDKSEEERNGVQIVMRIGARVYITVPGDLNMNTVAETFEFLTDSNEQYKQFLQRNATANYETVYLNLAIKNKGNLYTKVLGKATITDPDGQEFTQQFNRELVGNSQMEPAWINMQQAWKVGKYKAVYEWGNSPVVGLNKENVADNSETKRTEIEFEMTQEKLEVMSKLQEQADAEKPERVAAPAPTEEPELVEQAAKQETVVEADNTFLYATIGSLAGIVIIMGIIMGWFAYKNGKKEQPESSNTIYNNYP